MKRTLRELINCVVALKKSDFKFRFAGFQLTKTKLQQIDFGMPAESNDYLFNEYICMKNYNLIDPE